MWMARPTNDCASRDAGEPCNSLVLENIHFLLTSSLAPQIFSDFLDAAGRLHRLVPSAPDFAVDRTEKLLLDYYVQRSEIGSWFLHHSNAFTDTSFRASDSQCSHFLHVSSDDCFGVLNTLIST